MDETTEQGRESTAHRDAEMNASEVEAWFVREVLPLEAMLMQYLRHNWRDKSDIEDLRQEVYVRVCEAAFRQLPDTAKPFVFTTARNLLITRARQSHVIPIEAVADLDALGVAIDTPGPDRSVIARDELRRLQAAIDRLPPRCARSRRAAADRRPFAARNRSAHGHQRSHGLRASGKRHARLPTCSMAIRPIWEASHERAMAAPAAMRKRSMRVPPTGSNGAMGRLERGR